MSKEKHKSANAGLKIKSLFIANRGEICRRIATTAKRLGIKTTTILTEKHPPLFLRHLIDEFIPVSWTGDQANPYLDGSKLIDLAKKHGCDAIHPGFGFLSERSDFAKDVKRSGLTWVGPNPESMDALGSKDAARKLAKKLGIPCTDALEGVEYQSGNDGNTTVLKDVAAFGKKVGYPILIKAAYGGGGKGMRLVTKEDELASSLDRCSSEAKNAFGNGLLLVEKYLNEPRHIEVQILGDQHGHVLAVGDRDCSVQRRHQKIIEEGPAPTLTDFTRKAIHASAVKMAKSMDYDNAGTVEFLIDDSQKPNAKGEQAFYFLEMNTRLQVEHPVTEAVTGQDLVAWQLKIASGAELTLTEEDTRPHGHAIEVRFYAEDVDKNFLPSPGKVHAFLPHYDQGIRWEIGLDTIDEISTRFDPMIAKVIAHGPDRQGACGILRNCLLSTVFVGPNNNRNYLAKVLEEPQFLSAKVNTHYVKHNHDKILADLNADRKASEPATFPDVAASRQTGNDPGPRTESIFAAGPRPSAERRTGFEALSTCSETSVRFPQDQITYGSFSAGKDSNVGKYVVVRSGAEHLKALHTNGFTYVQRLSEASLDTHTGVGKNTEVVTAPVPGKVVKVVTKAGEAVEENSVLLILESMKMEFEVRAPIAGKVGSCKVKAGDQVNVGQELITWQAKKNS